MKKILQKFALTIMISTCMLSGVAYGEEADAGGIHGSSASAEDTYDSLNLSDSSNETTITDYPDFDTGLNNIPNCTDKATCFDRGASRYIKITEIFKHENQDTSYLANNEQIKNQPIETVIIRIINYMLRIIGGLCVFLIVVAGAMMVLSAGNEEYYNKGKEIITGCIIGLVLAFSAYIIVNFVMGLFF